MEWVETTGRTLEEAKDAALDQLGVDEGDAEFEVLVEPRRGLFGLGGAEARVRARVRPTIPRPKDDRRRRRDGDRGGARGGRGRGASSDERATPPTDQGPPSPSGGPRRRAREARRRDGNDRDRADGDAAGAREEVATVDEVPLTEQAELSRGFVAGLVEAFGVDGDVTATVDEDALDVAVTGADLGLLIGPKGQTLQAIQELARTALQRQVPGRTARLHVDVAGYREKRRQALERFTQQVAAQVLASGERRVLEPMNPADRKVVHDTANTIAGVATMSEGEEPRRRVVILPAPAAEA